MQYGGKNIRNYIQYFLHLVLFSLCAFLLTVFVLRVLLSSYVYLFILCVFVVPYVYLLYYVCIDILTLDAGLLARSQYPEVSCDRPPRHRFFLVSLCLKANAQMVPQFPSRYYMPLM
jgi:hypothetical protein